MHAPVYRGGLLTLYSASTLNLKTSDLLHLVCEISAVCQPKGDLGYSGASHNGLEVHFAVEECVVQTISELC